jgi:hypothetical protein
VVVVVVVVADLYYFLAAPTLCYQMEYPRTPHIRWSYLASLTLRWVRTIFDIDISYYT